MSLQFSVRRLTSEDFGLLHTYLQKLNPETQKRFGPHAYDIESIRSMFQMATPDRSSTANCNVVTTNNIGYIAISADNEEIVAYSIVKIGYLEHDKHRLESYGLSLSTTTDCTFAPSVADSWQSRGVGSSMFRYILSDIETIGIKRIILWGGVQALNHKALLFYQKFGFTQLGQFEYNGFNFDMVLKLRQNFTYN